MSQHISAKKCLKFIFTFIVTILITLVWICSFLLALPIFCFRYFLILYARRYRPDLGKIMTTRSAVFASDDLYGKPRANILLVASVSGKFELEELRKTYLNSMVLLTKPNGEFLNPELQQNVTFLAGFPFWQWDKPFRIENHIREYECDAALTPELANQLCTEYLKTPLTPGQSPWEMILFPKCQLNGTENDGERSGFIIKIHHSMADGFSLLTFSSSAMDPGEKRIETIRPSHLNKNNFQKFGSLLAFLLKAPFQFVRGLIDAFDLNECHIPESKLSENILLGFSDRIPLQLFKDIKTNCGVSLTAVLLAGFTGAVRSFMLENGLRVPEALHSVTPFPMPGHSGKLRNLLTTCFIKLPVGLPTPEERLVAIEKYLKVLKQSTQPITMFYFLASLGALPTFIVKIFIKQYGPTALISNFPGPQQQIHLLGRPLEDIMFTAGMLSGNIGIGFNAMSYNGSVRIQAAFNEAVGTLPCSSTFLLEKVIQELQSLAELQHNICT